MGRDPQEFAAAAAPYVCVRITDLRDLDIHNLRFDFDLTFAALVMHADGTILHRYGSRSAAHADEYLSVGSFARLLRDSLADHRAHVATAAPATVAPLRAIDLPPLQKRLANGQRIDCVHCHTVHDAEHELAEFERRWRRDDLWVFPDPARLGLRLDPARQELVTAVTADSPAAKVGLQPGDALLALGEQRLVRTLGDVSWALHRAPSGDTTLAVRWRRGADEHDGTIALTDGWKRCPPAEYAWRPYKWNLSPSCGFGGQPLDAKAKERLGLGARDFAFTVTYIVDWGERAHRGRAAATAGLRKGDVLLEFAGRKDFASMDEFHAWIALELTAGTAVGFTVLRGHERKVLRYALPE